MNFRVSGVGPAILLLHGLPTSGRLWDYVVRTLQPQFTCVVVDLPGLGESPLLEGGSLDPDCYAQELETLREGLCIPSWHVMGHDAGSTIAIHYAAQFGHRLNKLVLCSPPIFPEHKVPWFFRLMRIPLVGEGVALIATTLMWRTGFHLTDKHDRHTADIVEAFRRPFRGYRGIRRLTHLVRWGDPVVVLAKTAALLPDVAAPTLILHGKNDGVIPISFANRAAATIPGARAHILDCGHFIPLFCPEGLCELLLPFLQEGIRSW